MSAADVRMEHTVRAANRVALGPAQANPLAAIVFFALFVVLFVVLAVFNVYPSATIGFVAGAVFLMLMLVAVVVLNRQLSAGIVRIDRSAAGIRFIAPATVPVLFLVASVVGLVPGIVALSDGLAAVGRGLAIFSLVSLVWLVQQLWSLRLPVGLTLDEHGIRGVRGSKAVDLGWDDLARAEAANAKGPRLVLHRRASGAIRVDPHYLSSDPNVIAAVIEFFREHPQHRAALATPMAALALVEEHAKTTAD